METEILLKNCQLSTFYWKIIVTFIILLFFVWAWYIYFSKEDELIKIWKVIKWISIIMWTTFCLRILFDMWIPC